MHKEIFINGTEAGISNRFKAQVIERRPGHPDCGKIVRETDWANNLILENGMNNIASITIAALFTYCCVGTDSTPTVVSSGAVTASTSGTTCTSFAGFFNSGMTGMLIYFPGTTNSAVITHYTNSTTVTLSATLAQSSAVFEVFAINQTGLNAEVHRTNNYLTGAGNCGTTYSAGLYTHTRTFDFPIESGDELYYEVGFSNNSSAGANLNMRGIFSAAPVAVVTGQQIRVVYQALVTVTPISARLRNMGIPPGVQISGWPALLYTVAFTPSSPTITMAGQPAFTQNTPVFFEGTTAPTGITFGTVYYANPAGTDLVNTLSVSATPSGSAITVTSSGTDADQLYTNTIGHEILGCHQFSGVGTDGSSIAFSVPNNGSAFGEPSQSKYMAILTDTNALPTFPGTGVFPGGGDTPTGGTQALVAGSYVSGSYTLTWSVTYSVDQGNSNAIFKLCTIDPSGGAEGLIYLFTMPQQKSNTYTLTIVWQWTWDRILT